MDATINGLMDGISVLEHKEEQPALVSDILFNDESADLILPYDEFIYPSIDYYPHDYMDVVSLLSMSEETFQASCNGDVM